MSLAISYQMKKRMAKGGVVDHEKGVHKKSYSSGNPAHAEESDLGNAVRTQPSFAKAPKTDYGRKWQDAPRQQVREVIAENRAIHPNIKGLAHGGEVKRPDSPNWKAKGWQHEKEYDKGVHREQTGTGQSWAGELSRKGHGDHARMQHERKLNELKSMPKPNLKGLAEGGDVDDDMISQIMKKRCMSEGGMVANDTDFSADEQDADYDYLAHNDELAFHDTAKNSGDEDNDDDIIARVMRKRRG